MKITLPLIYAIKMGTKIQSELIKNSIKLNKINELPNIISILEDTKAINAVKKKAEEYLVAISEAANKEKDSPYKKMIMDLAEYAINRKG